jgi:hypothetical protein
MTAPPSGRTLRGGMPAALLAGGLALVLAAPAAVAGQVNSAQRGGHTGRHPKAGKTGATRPGEPMLDLSDDSDDSDDSDEHVPALAVLNRLRTARRFADLTRADTKESVVRGLAHSEPGSTATVGAFVRGADDWTPYRLTATRLENAIRFTGGPRWFDVPLLAGRAPVAAGEDGPSGPAFDTTGPEWTRLYPLVVVDRKVGPRPGDWGASGGWRPNRHELAPYFGNFWAHLPWRRNGPSVERPERYVRALVMDRLARGRDEEATALLNLRHPAPDKTVLARMLGGSFRPVDEADLTFRVVAAGHEGLASHGLLTAGTTGPYLVTTVQGRRVYWDNDTGRPMEPEDLRDYQRREFTYVPVPRTLNIPAHTVRGRAELEAGEWVAVQDLERALGHTPPPRGRALEVEFYSRDGMAPGGPLPERERERLNRGTVLDTGVRKLTITATPRADREFEVILANRLGETVPPVRLRRTELRSLARWFPSTGIVWARWDHLP